MNKMTCVLLAAGKGTRMKSSVPKVLHEVCERPMIDYAINSIRHAGVGSVYVVAGHEFALVKEHLKQYRGVKIVRQKKLLGTADAVNSARSGILKEKNDVVILYADAPLVTPQTLKELIKTHKAESASCTMLTTILKDPSGYGRIVRNADGNVVKIAEDLDASPIEKAVEEVNVGVYCFKSGVLFKAIDKIKPQNAKKEYYLTDAISILAKNGEKIATYTTQDSDEMLGINSRVDLAKAGLVIRSRFLKSLMESGVTVFDPNLVCINPTAKIGRDTVIYPFTVIEKNVVIGKNCSVGPFCRLRPGTVLDDNVEVGNFLEISRSHIKSFAKVKHQSFIGDTTVGKNVNIGAGTIVANYDGKNKNKTYIDDGAFIGSGTILIAPVKIGKKAITGAGAVVTKGKHVPPGAVVIGVPARRIKKTK